MKIIPCSTPADMGRQAGESILVSLEHKPSSLLCLATGNSPVTTYAHLVAQRRKSPGLFARARVIKLDEWYGAAENDPHSCEAFLQEKVIRPLEISTDRYISFNGLAPDATVECRRIQEALQQAGSIDVCVLGLGTNGHLGFNEPAPVLQPHCHQATLAPSSGEHAMVHAVSVKPSRGLTLGMKDILESKKIILLVAGEGKEGVTERLMRPGITTQVPASLLWLHANVECYLLRAERP